MGHMDKGRYAAKRPGKTIDKPLAEEIRAVRENNSVSCAAAHEVSRKTGSAPAEIGVQIDLLEFRISKCRLGLFGYSPHKKRIDPDIDIPDALDEQIGQAAENGRISCRRCWEIAENQGVGKLMVGSACEKKNIRIKPCQLGAF